MNRRYMLMKKDCAYTCLTYITALTWMWSESEYTNSSKTESNATSSATGSRYILPREDSQAT